tara:strand:+ start:362 stop:1195 length:834 start_codon:yes stop_codon:yes gene_type:complete
MDIDTHNHFWIYDPLEYDWIDGSMSLLKRNYLPEEFSNVLANAAIGGCIAVQARQSDAETDWLLKLSDEFKIIKGVIGWVDLCNLNLHEFLEQKHQHNKLKGFRHVLQGEEDDFMLNPDFIRGIKILSEHDYCYEILVYENQLKSVRKLLNQLPEMRLVIDHIAKPNIKAKPDQDWIHDLKAISLHKHVYCKLSGMVTEADWENWTPENIFPFIEHTITCFGENRVMYGSDWPVCLLAAKYNEVKNLLEQYLATQCKDSRDKIFSSNAKEFYRLFDH